MEIGSKVLEIIGLRILYSVKTKLPSLERLYILLLNVERRERKYFPRKYAERLFYVRTFKPLIKILPDVFLKYRYQLMISQKSMNIP
jgi:hypothetical protein